MKLSYVTTWTVLRGHYCQVVLQENQLYTQHCPCAVLTDVVAYLSLIKSFQGRKPGRE